MAQLNFLDELGAPKDISTELFDYRPHLFDEAESFYYLQKFISTIHWSHTTLLLYGKEVKTPRLTAWFADEGIRAEYKNEAHEWTDDLLAIRARIEPLAGVRFNSVLLNYYRDGQDSVSWHDDEDGIPGKNKIVASVSFGQERQFDVRRKADHADRFSILLEDGSYLLMKEGFQSQWQHRIAKSKTAMRVRVNLTFRQTAP